MDLFLHCEEPLYVEAMILLKANHNKGIILNRVKGFEAMGVKLGRILGQAEDSAHTELHILHQYYFQLGKVYIKDPSEAPEGVTVHTGPRDGLFYYSEDRDKLSKASASPAKSNHIQYKLDHHSPPQTDKEMVIHKQLVQEMQTVCNDKVYENSKRYTFLSKAIDKMISERKSETPEYKQFEDEARDTQNSVRFARDALDSPRSVIARDPDTNKIVGAVGYDRLSEGKGYFIEMLGAIQPGKGVGSTLLDSVKEQTKPGEKLSLFAVDTTGTLNFYKDQGFVKGNKEGQLIWTNTAKTADLGKVYIKDPSEAPDGVTVQTGPRHGIFYNSEEVPHNTILPKIRIMSISKEEKKAEIAIFDDRLDSDDSKMHELRTDGRHLDYLDSRSHVYEPNRMIYQALNLSKDPVVVRNKQDEVIGAVSYKSHKSLKDLEIDRLGSLQKGVGSLLIEHTVAKAEREKYDTISLYSLSTAGEFYKHKGFEETGVIDDSGLQQFQLDLRKQAHREMYNLSEESEDIDLYKRYVTKDPSKAPAGANVQTGPKGGLYYDTDELAAYRRRNEADPKVQRGRQLLAMMRDPARRVKEKPKPVENQSLTLLNSKTVKVNGVTVTVGKLTETDTSKIADDLIKQLRKMRPSNSKFEGIRMIYQAVALASDLTVVKNDKEEIVGAINLKHYTDYVEVDRLGSIQKGVGSLLMNDAIREADQNRCNSVILEPLSDAEGFYTRLGFTDTGEIDPDSTLPVWSLDLTKESSRKGAGLSPKREDPANYDNYKKYVTDDPSKAEGAEVHTGPRKGLYVETDEAKGSTSDSSPAKEQRLTQNRANVSNAITTYLETHSRLPSPLATVHEDNGVSTLIANHNGFHAPPIIVTPEEFNKLENDPNVITMRRGIGGVSLDGFIEGTNSIQRKGIYGSGCYTHETDLNPNELYNGMTNTFNQDTDWLNQNADRYKEEIKTLELKNEVLNTNPIRSASVYLDGLSFDLKDIAIETTPSDLQSALYQAGQQKSDVQISINKLKDNYPGIKDYAINRLGLKESDPLLNALSNPDILLNPTGEALTHYWVPQYEGDKITGYLTQTDRMSASNLAPEEMISPNAPYLSFVKSAGQLGYSINTSFRKEMSSLTDEANAKRNELDAHVFDQQRARTQILSTIPTYGWDYTKNENYIDNFIKTFNSDNPAPIKDKVDTFNEKWGYTALNSTRVTSIAQKSAEMYGGTVMKMALMPDALVIDNPHISASEPVETHVQKMKEIVDKLDIPQSAKDQMTNPDTILDWVSDEGLLAMLQGYDAYRIPKDATNLNANDYIVALNRSKVMLQSYKTTSDNLLNFDHTDLSDDYKFISDYYKRYIESPEDAPAGANVQTGPKKGIFYETNELKHDSSVPEKDYTIPSTIHMFNADTETNAEEMEHELEQAEKILESAERDSAIQMRSAVHNGDRAREAELNNIGLGAFMALSALGRDRVGLSYNQETGKVNGAIGWSITDNKSNKEIEIERLGAIEQGKGVGFNLLKATIREAQEHEGINKITLSSHPAAETFYDKIGFVYDGDHDHEGLPIMTLDLTKQSARKAFGLPLKEADNSEDENVDYLLYVGF